MIADFYDAFGKNTDIEKEIPEEILELLNKELPTNFIYMKDKNGNYRPVPYPGKKGIDFKLTAQFDLDESVRKRIEDLSLENCLKYFYRTQKIVPVKNLKIGDEKKVIPVEETLGNPLYGEKSVVTEAKMYPEKFPNPFQLIIESKENNKVSFLIQQQVYDSLAEIKFKNVNFPALNIEFYCYDPLTADVCQENPVTSVDAPFRMTFSVQPSRAKTVKDVISALNIFKGLTDGTAKINSEIIKRKDEKSTLTPEQIDKALEFWSIALQLEEKLNVSFKPSADFRMEDERLFKELKSCLIDKKEIVWKHPFDHFHVRGYKPLERGCQFEDFIGKEGICYKFWEGPIVTSLLGAEFNIYSHSEIKDFIITNIEWDNANKEEAEVYISDPPGKVIVLSRLYVTEDEFNKSKCT